MVVHASSSENTSYPLCRASRFAHVTACVENVTCEGCLAILDGRSPGVLVGDGGLDAHVAIGRARS